MQKHFDTLKKSRKLVLRIIKDLSIDQLNTIPEGFKNNIVWNVGHLVVTQQLLCYRMSEVNCLVSEDLIDTFRKGTAPEKRISEEAFETIKELFSSLPDQFERDYNNKIFNSYNPYTTSVNVAINSIDDALIFNTLHEGLHLGVILQLKKLV
jgi:hypothetical protein